MRGPLFITVRGPFTIAAPPAAGHRLQTRRLSSCGTQAQLLRGMWDLTRPGLEPVSPALAGRFSTTAPPGKPVYIDFYMICLLMSFAHCLIGLFEFFKNLLSLESSLFILDTKSLCQICILQKSPGLLFFSPLSRVFHRAKVFTYFYFFINLFYLFIFGCVGSSLLRAGFL